MAKDYFKIYNYKRYKDNFLFIDKKKSCSYYIDILIDNYRVYSKNGSEHDTNPANMIIVSEIDLTEYIINNRIIVHSSSLSVHALTKISQFKKNTIIDNVLQTIKNFEYEYLSNEKKDKIMKNNYYIHKDKFTLINNYNYTRIKSLIFNSNEDDRSITVNDSLLYEYFLTYIKSMSPIKYKCTVESRRSDGHGHVRLFGLFNFLNQHINNHLQYTEIKLVKNINDPSTDKHIYYDLSTNKIIIDNFYNYVNNNIFGLRDVVLNNTKLEIDINLLKNNLHCVTDKKLADYVKTEHVTIIEKEYVKNIDFIIDLETSKINEYNYYY